MNLDKIINRFLLGEGRDAASPHGYLQTIDETLASIVKKSLKDQRRVEVAQECVRGIRAHLRKMEGRLMEMEQQALLETNKNKDLTADEVAKFFHETYERLAPDFSYKTRKASAVEWEDVPENNKKLMTAVAEQVIKRFIKNDQSK